MAIPKIIHYVWMGGKEKPPKIKKCIKTWKKHLKDYEFIEWNEKNGLVYMTGPAVEIYRGEWPSL